FENEISRRRRSRLVARQKENRSSKTAYGQPKPMRGSATVPQHCISPVLVPLGAPAERRHPLSCRGRKIGRAKKGGFLNFSRPFGDVPSLDLRAGPALSAAELVPRP